jgi:DNA-binding MarR family transcriptional regulator
VELLEEAKKREVAERCAHFQLKRTVRTVTQHFDSALSETGLHVTQFTLLVTSSLMGSVPVTELADRLAMDRTTLTRNLKPLERDGLLKTHVAETDARVRLVQITPKGEEVVARAYPLWEKAQKEVTETFTDQQYAGLLAYLNQLQAAPTT